MSGSSRSRLNGLNVGGGGAGGNKEWMFAVALGVIIAGSLALAIYSFLDRGSVATVEGDGKWHFICLECGEEKIVDPKDFAAGQDERVDDPAMAMIDCPHCGAVESMAIGDQCPRCKKYFVPEDRQAFLYGEDEPEEGGRVCPHCNLNLKEYYRKLRENR
ncbi:MAG: hypothetical protein ACLFVU_11875 [Phycisphaerae bacterium]